MSVRADPVRQCGRLYRRRKRLLPGDESRGDDVDRGIHTETAGDYRGNHDALVLDVGADSSSMVKVMASVVPSSFLAEMVVPVIANCANAAQIMKRN
jgi:hypothetical protein